MKNVAIGIVLCLYLATVAAIYAVSAMPKGDRATGYVLTHALLGALAAVLFFLRPSRVHQRRILLVSILGLLVLVAVPMFTSNDAMRYLWDGRAAALGFDPYVTTPDSPELQGDMSSWPRPPDHADVPTIYPPFAMGFFALCALSGSAQVAWWAWKGFTITAAIVVAVLTYTIAERHRNARWVPLVVLSPVLLLESAVGAHVDTLSTCMLSVAVWCAVGRRAVSTGLFLGLGTLIKLVPALVLVPLATHHGRRWWMVVAAWGVVVGIGYVIPIAIGWQPIGSLARFAAEWQFGSPLYLLASELNTPAIILKVAIAVPLLAALIWAVARRQTWVACHLCLVTPFAISPVVFPWYLVAFVPLLAVRPSVFVILWMFTMPFTYEVIDGWDVLRRWEPADWPMWVVLGGWVVGLAADLRPRRKSEVLGATRSAEPRAVVPHSWPTVAVNLRTNEPGDWN